MTDSNTLGSQIQAGDDSSNVKTLSQDYVSFKPYDPQLDISISGGKRLVKCLYKGGEGKKKVRENEYVLIPAHITPEIVWENVEKLMPFIISFLEDTEDKWIKEDHRKGRESVYLPALGIDKVIELLIEEESSGRLSKEVIETWFDDHMFAGITELGAASLGVDLDNLEGTDEDKINRLSKIVDAYKAKFCSLAGGKTILVDEDKEAMKSVLAKIEGASESHIGVKIKMRLENMKEKEADILTML